MSLESSSSLKGVEAFTFDVFGTVVDWLNTGVRALKERAKKLQDLNAFTDAGAWLSLRTLCAIADRRNAGRLGRVHEGMAGWLQRTDVRARTSSSFALPLPLNVFRIGSSRVSAGLHGLGGRTLSVDVMHREVRLAVLDHHLSLLSVSDAVFIPYPIHQRYWMKC